MSTEQPQSNAPWFLIVLLAFFLVLPAKVEKPPDVPPEPPNTSTGFLPDLRVHLDKDVHALLAEFIRTGKISKGRLGVNMAQVDTIRCERGRLIFDPPIHVSYDGPGPLNAGTTVKEIRVEADGEILIDVVNSPVDVILNGQ